MRGLEKKLPPPVVALSIAAAMWYGTRFAPHLDIQDGLRWSLCAVLAIVGLAFDVAGLLAFHGAKTTINPLRPEKASRLVVSGVYRLTRNPMYVGLAVNLLAWSAYLAAPLTLAGPVAFILYITRFQILPEERVLLGLFGEAYRAYCRQVPRWL